MEGFRRLMPKRLPLQKRRVEKTRNSDDPKTGDQSIPSDFHAATARDRDVTQPQQTSMATSFLDEANSGMTKGHALDDSSESSLRLLDRDDDESPSYNGGTTQKPPIRRREQIISIPEQSYSMQLNETEVRRNSGVSQCESFVTEHDTPDVIKSYGDVPILEQTKLPRGGISMETSAVGRVQFGIPPETIKDSMGLGLTVPSVYIVPIDRFCREMGPALGVNLAEFEFPAYFNFFVNKKQCTLVVDSDEAEENIRRVFSETLLGPAQFRREKNPITYEEEDFAPDFPREAIPNFQKEFRHFRIMPDGKELVLETLLKFCHFDMPGEIGVHDNLGVPPPKGYGRHGDGIPSTTSEVLGNDDQVFDCSLNNVVEREQDEEVVYRNEESQDSKMQWTFSRARWVGDVATVWAPDATPEQIAARACKRVEIFKMPGGTEYILHDVDENNFIVGKARFSGNVKVSESMGVHGFGTMAELHDSVDEIGDPDTDDVDSDNSEILDILLRGSALPPTFNPPSFGVTILGNSHGFDKSGSVSGYVLWINGRGVMIDPPPYSSATLEREGIRPRTIVGIILTHCHADHDAGAFQKVLTGSPVVVITTPTIYKSFIRKYAALSALSPALLRHSHRHKPAIIGAPLRFQGATFHFTYTLHTIPCVGFRVDWRGRSMVFTGDHFNFPPALNMLQESGVLSKARADDLRNLPLQETDLLLHEAGAPPIHTPLDVLLKLPQRVKRRMYVVHTSALPEGCDLRVAPTGTAGTIRLDQAPKAQGASRSHRRLGSGSIADREKSPWPKPSSEYDHVDEDIFVDLSSGDSRILSSSLLRTSETLMANAAQRSSSILGSDLAQPLVSLRPASSTDAWFILNLLSAVPFLTSLSYASTMEVLETARVDAYCQDEVVVPAARRNQVLCVVWEGTCVERKQGTTAGTSRTVFPFLSSFEMHLQDFNGAVWYAGDWTGPISLQPEKRLSGESNFGSTHDVVAMSLEGVKAISIEFASLHAILKSGSSLYRKYLERRNLHEKATASTVSRSQSDLSAGLLNDALRTLNVLELLDCNSAMRKLNAVQKRHLESLVEGPHYFQPGERLWRAGAPVDRAFIVVSGTASFVPRRRNAGSVGLFSSDEMAQTVNNSNPDSTISLGESMRRDAMAAVRELRITPFAESASELLTAEGPVDDEMPRMFQLDAIFTRPSAVDQEWVPSSLTEAHDYAKLSRGLQRRADIASKLALNCNSSDSELVDNSNIAQNLENVFFELDTDDSGKFDSRDHVATMARRRSSKARFANKVLGRLYSRRAFTGGLVFSRGHFLGDVSKMVAGLLSTEHDSDHLNDDDADGPNYGFGERADDAIDDPIGRLEAVQEQDDNKLSIVHSSTLIAGKDGCVVLVFPKPNLIPFLDEYPGLLLSLLGTQAVV